MGIVTGPVRRGDGVTPAIGMVDPKFPHNVGAAVRAASCYGVRQVWFSGTRVRLSGVLGQCHRFVHIPTRHCTNLASAVYTVLYDRHAKRVRAGLEPAHELAEARGFDEPDHMAELVGVDFA